MNLLMRNDNVLIKVVRKIDETNIILPDAVKQNDEITQAKFIVDDFDVDWPANEGLSVNRQVYFSPFAARIPVDQDHFILKQEDIVAIADKDFEE